MLCSSGVGGILGELQQRRSFTTSSAQYEARASKISCTLSLIHPSLHALVASCLDKRTGWPPVFAATVLLALSVACDRTSIQPDILCLHRQQSAGNSRKVT